MSNLTTSSVRVFHLILIVFSAFLLLNVNPNKIHSSDSTVKKKTSKVTKKKIIQQIKTLFKKRRPDPGKPPMGRGAAFLLKLVLFSYIILLPLLAIGIVLLLLAVLTNISNLALLITGIALALLVALVFILLMNKGKLRRKKKRQKN